MNAALVFWWTGALLGLSAGLAPGPLLTLVASETLRHGARAGIGVALAPLLTDLPIVLVAVGLLRPLAEQGALLALIQLSGGLYLAWLGWQGVRFRGAELQLTDPTAALWRGVIANFLNPSPYLFWLTVGAPTVLAGWSAGWSAVVAFVVAFYAVLVGSKILLALALDRTRAILRSRGYVLLMRGLGGLLLVYALAFLYQSGRWLSG